MSMRSGFFNSIDGDRLYNAEDMNMPYKKLISNGVFPNPSTNLQVTASSGMTVQVLEGSGMFGDSWAYNDAPVLLALDPVTTNLSRVDAIIARYDCSEPVRAITLEVKKGTPAGTPAAPKMTRTDTVKEYCLATVMLSPGKTTVTGSMITDTRADASVCGWVTGLITQVDTTTLFAQWQAAYKEQYTTNTEAFAKWFADAKNIFANDGSAGGELIKLMIGKADKDVTVFTLEDQIFLNPGPEDSFEQEISIPGLSENDIIIVTPYPGYEKTWAECEVHATAMADGKITIDCAKQTGGVKGIVLNLGGPASEHDYKDYEVATEEETVDYVIHGAR